MRRARVLAALCAAALQLACGRRGDPLVPLLKNPPPPTGLKLALRGDHLEIRYQAPRATAGGQPLGVMDVEMLRLDGTGDFDKHALGQVKKVAPGESIVETLPLPAAGTVVRVALRASASGHESPRSAIAVLTVRVPPPAPTALSAVLGPAGASLRWTGPLPAPIATPSPSPSPSPRPGASASTSTSTIPSPSPVPSASSTPSPAASVPPANASPAPAASPGASPSPSPSAKPTPPPTSGFWIYRHDPSEKPDRPLVSAPLQVNTYEDHTLHAGETFCYEVRAVVSTDPIIESASSNAACVTLEDKGAPATPAGVLAVPGPEGIELSWTPSPDPDVAHYLVYRATGEGTAEKLATLPPGVTTWRDATPPADAVLRYTLTAIDASGNESAPSPAIEVRRP